MLPLKKTAAALPAKSGAFTRALERFREQRKADSRITRIGFIVDATGSRHATWEQAQTVQGRMFQAVAGLGRVSLRLVHFGGGVLTDHGWSEDTGRLAARMAAVRCHAGQTQVLPALRAFADDGERADAVILVGDAFEEEPDEALLLCQALRQRGIRVFAFFEGDLRAAEDQFRLIAETTGGRFARLGDDLPLADLCEGVALLAAGGEKAVRRLGNERARRLLLTGPSDRQS